MPPFELALGNDDVIVDAATMDFMQVPPEAHSRKRLWSSSFGPDTEIKEL